MPHRLSTLIAAVLLACALPAAAQDSAASAADPAPALFMPNAVRLQGLHPVYQQLNRCSAAALTIQLSYFQWDGDYTDTINGLNPHLDDVAVRLDEMATFARQQGLEAIARTGGTLDLLRALVAGGFPVLIENSYFEGGGGFHDWMGHNRVIMGYDDAQQALLTFDSLLGNGPDNTGRPVPYADIDERWRPFSRDYLVLYRPEEEARLRGILGEQWDERANAEWTLEQSQQEVGTAAEDGFTWFSIGSALVVLERFDEAAEAFDRAFEAELPWRMMWYQYGPYEAYLATGRYDDVLRIAQQTLATTTGVEETYYYRGMAYEAQGDLSRAENSYEVAVFRNRFYTQASEALDRVRAAQQPASGG